MKRKIRRTVKWKTHTRTLFGSFAIILVVLSLPGILKPFTTLTCSGALYFTRNVPHICVCILLLLVFDCSPFYAFIWDGCTSTERNSFWYTQFQLNRKTIEKKRSNLLLGMNAHKVKKYNSGAPSISMSFHSQPFSWFAVLVVLLVVVLWYFCVHWRFH